MLGTELAYVRERLGKISREERDQLAHMIGAHPKTLKRIAEDVHLRAPRSDIVGKLAVHFQTREKRSK